MKRSFAITGFAVLMLCVFSSSYAAVAQNEFIVAPSLLPPSSLANQKEPRSLVAGILDKFINRKKGNDNDVSTPECQRAIKQLGSFINSWNKGPRRVDHNFCWLMGEDCFYPHKKFPIDLYSSVATACGIGKGSAWKGKTHNLRCTDQLESFKGFVDKLVAATAVTLRYPPSHPVWEQMEEDCRDYGLCEFQLFSARSEVMISFSKIKAACNMG